MLLENNHTTAQPKKPKPKSTETQDRTKDETLLGRRGSGEGHGRGEKKNEPIGFSPPNETKSEH